MNQFGINYLSQRGEIVGRRSVADLASSQLSAGAWQGFPFPVSPVSVRGECGVAFL